MTIEEYAESRLDLAANWERANSPEFAGDGVADWIRGHGSLDDYLRADFGGNFDQGGNAAPVAVLEEPFTDANQAPGAPEAGAEPPPMDPDPLPPIEQPPFVAIEPPPDEVQPPFEIVPPPIIEISPPPVVVSDPPPTSEPEPVSPPAENQPTMTAQQYAASRPDLAANWDRAWNDPAYADDPVGIWVRSWGTFDAYLAQDYGGSFSTGGGGPLPTMKPDYEHRGAPVVLPPVIVTANRVDAQQPVMTAPVGNSAVTSIVSPNDRSLLGGIDQWLQTAASIYATATGRTPANTAAPAGTPSGGTTAGGGMSPNVKMALIAGGALLAGIFIFRPRRS